MTDRKDDPKARIDLTGFFIWFYYKVLYFYIATCKSLTTFQEESSGSFFYTQSITKQNNISL